MRISPSQYEHPANWLPYVVSRLNEIAVLCAETSSEVTPPKPQTIVAAIQEALRFIPAEAPTPSVVPTAEGDILFVWHKGGWDIEVEVGPAETDVWARRRDDGWTRSGALDDLKLEVRELLQMLG